LDDVFFEAHANLPRQHGGRDAYTEKAFRMLAAPGKPRILDIGCGTGTPTLALARLTGGEIIGIDITPPMIDEFKQKIEAAHLSHRVTARKLSMLEMDFPDESFDIIWAEGSVYNIGFDRALQEWRRLIRPGGFLVIHEAVWLEPDPPGEIARYFEEMYPAMRTVEDNLAAIPVFGYGIIGHFRLAEEAWWEEYYGPLEQRIAELRLKYSGDSEKLATLETEQEEVDMYRRYSRWYGSAFFVMRKAG